MDYSVELPAGRICLCECQVRFGRYHTYSLQYYVVYGMVLVAVNVRRYVSPEVRSEENSLSALGAWFNCSSFLTVLYHVMDK